MNQSDDRHVISCSSPEWFLARVRADVLPQVTERGEVLGASL